MEKESKDIFSHFFDDTNEMLCIISKGSRYVKVNHEWEKALGYSNSELAGKSIDSYIHPDDVEKTLSAVKRIMDKNENQSFVSRSKHLNGSYRWIEWHAFSSAGMIFVSARDITNRIEAEQEINISEQMFRSIFENSSLGIALVDLNGKYLMVNEALCKIMGYSPAELMELSFFQLTHPDDVELSNSTMQNVIHEKGKELNFSKRYIHKDGRTIWAEVSSGLLYDRENKPLYFITHVKDISYRKEVEDQIQKSEEKLRNLTLNFPGMVFQFTVDKDGKYGFDYISDHSMKYFGLDNKDKEGFFENFLARVAIEDQSKFISSIKKAVESFSRWEYEGKFVKPDGTELYFKGVSVPRMLMDKTVFDGVALDITESKRAEIELNYTKAILSIAFNQTPIPMVIVSASDYIIRIANTASQEFLGINNESEFLGKSLMDIHDLWQEYDKLGNPVPLSEMPVMLALNGIEIKNKEYFVKCHDGSVRWESVSSSTVRNRENEIIASFLVFPDITERKRIEELIANERNTLRALVDNIPDLVYVKDLECRFVIVNKTLANFLGRSVEYLIGKSDLDIFPDELSSEFYSDDTELLKTGKPIIEKEERIYDTNGNTIIFLTNKAPLYDSKGHIIGLVGTGHIITERKLVEEKVKVLNSELERKVVERTIKLNEAIKDLEAFSYSVSHDLRAPIRHIDGFVKMMYSKIPHPTETITGYYSKVEAATRRMSSMIDSLLYFSRLGRRELSLSWINLELFVKEIIDELKPDMEERQIKWNISLLPPLLCDKDLMKLAFENIISNAIKYTSKKNKAIITIGCKAITDEKIEVFIKDNGIGFDMAYADKLFGVFQRLHTSDEFEGIGIGLANARQIIQKHGGTIRAEGKLNKGAIFYITLPTKESNE